MGIEHDAPPRSPEPPVSLLYVATVPAPLRNFYVPYARHFRALGWHVDAAASGATEVPAIREAFDETYELPLSRSIRDLKTHARAVPALGRLLAARYDIVHVHTPIAAFLVRAVVASLPRRERPLVIYTSHGFHFHHAGRPLSNAAYRTAERVAGRWTDRLIVINDEDLSAARAARLVPRRRLTRLPGVGIDTTWYSTRALEPADRDAVRERLGVPAETPLFVAIGELHPNKRQADLVAALGAMRTKGAHIVLLGDGRDRARLHAAVRLAHAEARVHFLGFVEDVRPYVANAAAVVLPSEREGLSRAVMEAMAMARPVVATTARGNRELLGEDAGIIVPTGDVRALAAALDSIIEEPGRAEAMGRAGRARVCARYELETVIERHEQLYLSVLAEGRGNRSFARR